MQYRVQFLDSSARVVHELFADARNDVAAIELTVNIDWPPGAVGMRVLNVEGREIHSRVKGDAKN